MPRLLLTSAPYAMLIGCTNLSAALAAPTVGKNIYFATLQPGAELPSGAKCAELVHRSSWEPRPENRDANSTPGSRRLKIEDANESFTYKYGYRVDGNFTGTTDEIIQWASCKWGFDEDRTRARAVEESYWRQSEMGDLSYNDEVCKSIGFTPPCWQSYGVLQVKGTVHKGTYPLAENSTAFNVDYALAWLRACYEGAFDAWLGNNYVAGDEWGCIGAWYSGRWYGEEAKKYIKRVKHHLANREWLNPNF